MIVGTAPADQKPGVQQSMLPLGVRPQNQLVREIRDAVSDWRAGGGIRVSPLRLGCCWHHWADPQGPLLRLFYAQREAIETIIWLREVATRQTRQRRELEELSRRYNDGLVRYCSKMATGTGKTTVMGMPDRLADPERHPYSTAAESYPFTAVPGAGTRSHGAGNGWKS